MTLESEMSICEGCPKACKWRQTLFYGDTYLNASLCIFEQYYCNAQQAVESSVQAG